MSRIIRTMLFSLALLAAGCAVRPLADPALTLKSPEQVLAVRAALRHGDWLVTRGVHAADNLVATATNLPLSHAAIFDAENDGVIEADGSGVHATPLADFLANSQRVLVIRPIWSGPANSAAPVAAVELARSWIGKGYNFSGLFGLNMPERYYCTQVALFAYKPFITKKPDNPIPRIIKPGQMYHWGRIIYDSGPTDAEPYDE